MRKGYTLVELVVAVAILAIVASFAGAIFKVGIESHRMAEANAEIMQKLRAITDQLNSDFRGARDEIMGSIGFNTDGSGVRADTIVFFANGDFQSRRQYAGRTVRGNVAAIFYGQADDLWPAVDPNMDPLTGEPRQKILTRRQTILTSDPDPALVEDSDLWGEYYLTSLSELRAELRAERFDPNTLLLRRPLDVENLTEVEVVDFMARGVDDFTIEWTDGSMDIKGNIVWGPQEVSKAAFDDNPVVRALKFSFTLYDSKGIIEGGRRFTHIVYLDR
ncbi:MAG: pilus assembly FimT family protein [Planctomycetota bacterium]|jgi:prepilin-type N-terminal cleavage/methylation domain-containing protein